MRIYLFNYSPFFRIPSFFSHVQRLCSRKTDSIGHFICIHKNSWKKWVQFSLFDGALFILRVHYLRERKAWQWILHVKRLNAPFPKNFNLPEWFSTVEFFEFFSTFSPTFICVIETYGSVTFFYVRKNVGIFGYFRYGVVIFMNTFMSPVYTNETTQLHHLVETGFGMPCFMRCVCVRACVRECAHTSHGHKFYLDSNLCTYFSTWYEQLILWNVKAIRILSPTPSTQKCLILFSYVYFSVLFFISELNNSIILWIVFLFLWEKNEKRNTAHS